MRRLGRGPATGSVERMADVAFVLHGHFYQPPRENPWTEVVPRQPSAAPFHDWNERITAECYRPNGWARILDDHGRIVAIVDNYERLSFNVGPTLHVVARGARPRDLRPHRRRPTASGRRAIAQGYGHAILPLCNDRDLRTQVRWGLADFRHRFGRPAEGLWLPETAVDDRTLAVLAEEGVALHDPRPRPDRRGPRRRRRRGARPADRRRRALPGTARWRHPDRSRPRRRPRRLRRPDQPRRGVRRASPARSWSTASSGGPAATSCRWPATARRSATTTTTPTAGSPTRSRSRPTAAASACPAWPTGWPSTRRPTRRRVHVSAWSCAHGVGRWFEDCGCHTGGEPGWNQAWRGPLRAAFDRVRDAAVEVFERRGPAVLHDPWAARDAYVDVLLGRDDRSSAFAADHVAARRRGLVEALTLLESQRHALLDVHVVRLVLQRPGRPRDRADHAVRGLLLRPAGRAGRGPAGRRRAGHRWPRRRATTPTRATAARCGAATSTPAGSTPAGSWPTWP